MSRNTIQSAVDVSAEGRRFGISSVTHLYSGVTALNDVDFVLEQGVVHALVGENGSGKSTLVKILTGAVQPTMGTLHLGSKNVSFAMPTEAKHHGIGVVHQDYNLFPELTVAANVLGISQRPPRRRWSRMVDRAAVEEQVGRLLADLGIDVAPDVAVQELGPAERKFVEIARAMLVEPQFLILDEPTASLEPQESRHVLDLLGRLRDQGVGLAFVSHRLDEVLEIAGRITVLRDGKLVRTLDNDGVSEKEIAGLMLGEQQAEHVDNTRTVGEETKIQISGLVLRRGRRPVELEIREGEIFGLIGLLGSGAAEIVQMLGGARPFEGTLAIGGQQVTIRNPRDAVHLGIGFIPEDRKAAGLVADQSIAVNVSLPSLAQVARRGWLLYGKLLKRAHVYQERLNIRAPSAEVPVKTLSGGNQQKVMLAKWLASGSSVLAIEEPTHGVDIGAKLQVHDLLREFTARDGTILLASTDIHEVIAVCDRVGVMRHGELVNVLRREALTHQDLVVMGAGEPEKILKTLVQSGTKDQADAGGATA